MTATIKRRALTVRPPHRAIPVPPCFGHFSMDHPECSASAPPCLVRALCTRYHVACRMRGVDPAVEVPLIGLRQAYQIARRVAADRVDPSPYVDPGALVAVEAWAVWPRWRQAFMDVLPPATVLIQRGHQTPRELWWETRVTPASRGRVVGVGYERDEIVVLMARAHSGDLASMRLAIELRDAVARFPGAAALGEPGPDKHRPGWTVWRRVPPIRVEDAGRLAGRLLLCGLDGGRRPVRVTPGGLGAYY